jgi:ABC-2 type transport system ATP-binding protein
LDLLGLREVANERLERYSSGMKQKVSLARAILHDPDILLLDEPTLGLDPQFGRFIRQFIKEELNQKQGKTILLTTHYMDEADELCQRIAFINRGSIVDIKTPAEYKREIPHKEVLEIRCLGQPDVNGLKNLNGIEQVQANFNDGITTVRIVLPRAEKVLSEVIEFLRPQARLLGVDVKEPTLEDVFIYMTGTSLAPIPRSKPRTENGTPPLAD